MAALTLKRNMLTLLTMMDNDLYYLAGFISGFLVFAICAVVILRG